MDWKAPHEAGQSQCSIRLSNEAKMQSEENRRLHLTKNQGQSLKGLASSPQASKRSETLRCPKCEGSRIRNRGIFLSFLVTIAGLVVLLLLENSAAVLLPDKLMLILSFALVFSFCVLSSAAWSAFLGTKRCVSCGHRFRPLYGTEQREAETDFPIRLFVLNTLLLFLICVVGRYVMELLSGAVFSMIVIEVVESTITLLIFIVLSLGYQVVVYLLLKTRIRRELLWAILLLVPAIVLGADCLYKSLPTVAARRILSHGELAPLPESAVDIKVFIWASLFSGEEFLRFRASPDDIERFLDESPILRGAECERFSRKRMRLHSPHDPKKWGEYQEAGHELFVPDSSAPPWYKEEIKQGGRRYIIHPEWGHYPGEVIVDGEEQIVFIKVVWS